MRYALKHVPREQVIIVTKTYAESDKQTKRDVAAALKRLGTDYIDILLLHYTHPEWLGQLPRLAKSILDQKKSGQVRAVGISTHSVAAVRLAAEMPEVEVVETVVNRVGNFNSWDGTIGEIEDGTLSEMLSALEVVHNAGKGVIAMKILGSGTLSDDPAAAIAFVVALPAIDTLCIGMKSLQEIEADARAIMCNQRGGDLR
jgi:aryl-alcohol dehydrogenase-like predicted oxidoreductase